MYAIGTALVAATPLFHAVNESSIIVAVSVFLVKAIFMPLFLARIMRRMAVEPDPGAFVPVPVSMHLSIVLLGICYWIAGELPSNGGHAMLLPTTASISLLLIGILFMLTRRLAISQIIGFLTMENGIYLFAQSQTQGMPLVVEMGVLLDVLVAVMIAGIILFRIKRNFEHIDVTKLNGLKEY